jgi:hypothetical protein
MIRIKWTSSEEVLTHTHAGAHYWYTILHTTQEALSEGVKVHGKGRWKKILEGSEAFHGVRTAVDLKVAKTHDYLHTITLHAHNYTRTHLHYLHTITPLTHLLIHLLTPC